MTGILKKHADDNWYTRTFDDFERRLESGRIGVAMLRPYDLYGSECGTCQEKVTAFKYKGQRYDLQEHGGMWVIHQCAGNKRFQIGPDEGHPEPEYGEAEDIAAAQAEARGEIYPDDPEVRDGDGEIRSGGWHDDKPPQAFFPDPDYGYPDIPYSAPNWRK